MRSAVGISVLQGGEDVNGTGYSTYAQYRSGLRPLPRYHKNHVQALLLLQPDALAILIKEHTHGGSEE